MAMVLNSPTPTVIPSNFSYFRVQQSTHDGHTSSTRNLIFTGTQLIANHTSEANQQWQSFALLTDDDIGSIPQGKTIKKALLHLTSDTNRSNAPTSKMSFELADNPAVPSSKADLQARTRGSILSFAPSPNPYATDNPFTVDLTSRVQTMVSRSGWQSNKLLWLFDFNGDYDGNNTFVAVHSFDSDPALAPYLEVEW